MRGAFIMADANTQRPEWRKRLAGGLVIPAHPLALTAERRLDERRQRALTRYYLAAGAGGLAVGVHTTQFAIRDPEVGLFGPVLELAAEEIDRFEAADSAPVVRIAGIWADAPGRHRGGADFGRRAITPDSSVWRP